MRFYVPKKPWQEDSTWVLHSPWFSVRQLEESISALRTYVEERLFGLYSDIHPETKELLREILKMVIQVDFAAFRVWQEIHGFTGLMRSGEV